MQRVIPLESGSASLPRRLSAQDENDVTGEIEGGVADVVRVDWVRPIVRPGWTARLGRLSRTEWRRRAWHFAPGLLPWISCVVPHQDPLSLAYRLAAMVVIAALFFAAVFEFRTFRRHTAESRIGPIVGYTLPAFTLFLLFPAHVELALVTLAVVAYGDGTATLVGRLFGERPLPWNPEKSWAGTIAFVLVAAPLATLAYWGEAQPRVSLSVAVACGVTATLFAALAESLPARWNDNFRVGVAAAVTVLAVHATLVGLA
ncbi:MAG TPA: hypothetical protein EYP14_01455 [Planctomycetaceae bacterium]|nr:hypothetical protein [Planctomycetaceae bacterium]